MRCVLPATLFLVDLVRRPGDLFARLVAPCPDCLMGGSANAPRLGMAFLWLLVLGCASGVTGMHAALQGKMSYGQNWWVALPVPSAVLQSMWFCLTDTFWAALLVWLLARLVRESVRLDSLYVALAAASFPALLTTLLFPLRDNSAIAYHAWLALNVVVACWLSALICIAVRVCLRCATGKAVQCALPALLIWWAIAGRAHIASPTSFRAACQWQVTEGKFVRVFTQPGKPQEDITQLVTGLDATVQRDCDLLHVAPLAFKIDIFCFDSDAQQRRLAGDDEEPDNTAHTFWDCITLSYDRWPNLRTQMAHELCHVLLANHFTDRVHGLLDEGLCEWVAHHAAKHADTLPAAVSPIPLRTLVQPEVFFDWEQAREEQTLENERRASGTEHAPSRKQTAADATALPHPQHPTPDSPDDPDGQAHYITAESLVTYLIKRNGLPRFKQLYTRYGQFNVSGDPDADAGTPFARAVQSTYHLTLPQLEAQWRKAMPVKL